MTLFLYTTERLVDSTSSVGFFRFFPFGLYTFSLDRCQAGISTMTPRELASPLHCLPAILNIKQSFYLLHSPIATTPNPGEVGQAIKCVATFRSENWHGLQQISKN